MVTTFYPPYHFGGDAVYVRQLARSLVERGHEVEVVHCVDSWRLLANGKRPDAPDDEPLEGLRVHRLESPLRALSPIWTQQTGRPGLKRKRLLGILERDFDVINYHNISLVGGPDVLRLGNAVKLYTLHEHWWVCPTHVLWKYTGELCTSPECLRCCAAQGTPPQLWRRAVGWMARCLAEVDSLLVANNFTAERHRAWMRAAGVDVPLEPMPGFTAPLPAGEDTRIELPPRFFLYVGRLVRAKGTHALLDAFARRRDYPLVIVGEGSERDALARRALRNVRFVGRQSREGLAHLYARAEALVFPSLSAETFSLVACEALSSGTPVISSHCGGTEELLAGGAGLFYSGEEELLEQLDRIWNEPDLRARLGAAGRSRYESRYTPEAYLERYLAVIERVRARRTRAHSNRR